MGFIYKIYNDINDKVYVGITTQSINRRWQQHLRVSKYGLTKLYVAMQEYGIDHFFISVIEETTNDLLTEKEQLYIQQYDSYNNGYNSTIGGELFLCLTSEEIDCIVELYKLGLSIAEIARIVKHDTHTCSKALKNMGIEVIQHRIDKMPQGVHKVKIIELNLSFNTIREAAKYLSTEGIINASVHAIECGIGLSAKEYRSYKGFNFRYEN